jgi:sn-glycerol 3-phosphate transport system permease protein
VRRRDQAGPYTYLVAVLAVVVICLPLVWMLAASLKTRAELYSVPVELLPADPQWSNYSKAWNAVPFGRFFVNSVITTVLATLLKLLNGVLTAYALVFMDVRIRKFVFVAVVAALMVPEQVVLIPNYVLVSDLDWLNTYQGLVVPNAAVALGTFLMRQHFLTIPTSLVEAARLDGVGHLGLLWKVLLPVSRPSLAAFAVIAVVARWNDYLWPLLVTNTDQMKTLPVGLTLLQDSEGQSEWGIVMAGAVMVVVPIILLFLRAQRHLVEGLTAGSVKG